MVSKYLILEVISYAYYVEEGTELIFSTSKSMRAIIVENQSATYKIFRRKKVVNIEDSFWKLASPRIMSKNIMFNLKTEEDLMILSDFKRINKKMKVEGIILPNKLIES